MLELGAEEGRPPTEHKGQTESSACLVPFMGFIQPKIERPRKSSLDLLV